MVYRFNAGVPDGTSGVPNGPQETFKGSAVLASNLIFINVLYRIHRRARGLIDTPLREVPAKGFEL